MSRENVALVRRGYTRLNDAYREGHLDPTFVEEMWHRDCVLKPAGILPESRAMHGHDGVVGFIAAQMEAFEQMTAQPEEFIEAGDKVVVPFRFGGLARHTGIPIDFSVVHVWTVKGGKVARLDMYRTKAEALGAVRSRSLTLDRGWDRQRGR